jgi:hypothetical protein
MAEDERLTAGQRRPRQVGGILHKLVELLENEHISRSDIAWHWRGRWTTSLGRLYLTNFRLVYSGMPLVTLGLLGLPWPRESLTLNLDDIRSAGRTEQVWPEYLRRGIAADAFFVGVNGEKHHFGIMFGRSSAWVSDLKRPPPLQNADDEA